MSAVDVFPLSTSAYIADTQHLSLLQDGAYLRIMMTMWRAGGWIDDDDRTLANICKLSLAKWIRIASPVRALLLAREGKLSQKRLLFEIEKELKRVFKNKQNGSAGGRAKALKNNRLGLATAKVSPEGRQPPRMNATSSPTSLFQGTENQKKERKGSRGMALPSDWQPTEDALTYGAKLRLSPAEIQTMAEDMRLWARANANRAVGRKADWSATFLGWMRRESGKRRGHRYESRNGAASLLVRMMEEHTDGPDAPALDDERTPPARHA